jgi:ankyrin repeat protein
LAAGNGHAATVMLLLRHGADVGTWNLRGQTASDVAEQQGHHNVRNLLRLHRFLYEAVEDGDEEGVQELIATGTNVNVRYKADTPLHAASLGGYTQAAEFLLLAGADVNAKTAHQVTPLHSAGMLLMLV